MSRRSAKISFAMSRFKGRSGPIAWDSSALLLGEHAAVGYTPPPLLHAAAKHGCRACGEWRIRGLQLYGVGARSNKATNDAHSEDGGA